MSKPDLTIAYLRVFDSKNCDIRFVLNCETTDGQSLTKEIQGLATATDTLAKLKRNIQKKIIELNESDKENDEKMSLKLPSSPEEIKVEIFRQEKPYKDTILIKDFCKLTEEKFLKVFDEKFPIIINAPLVRVLKLSTMIVANFPTEPLVFKWHQVSKEATKFIWYKSLDKNEWEKVGEGYEYDVKESDVEHFLKLCCVPFSNLKVKGPVVEAVSDHKVDLIGEFPTCPFEERHKSTTTKLKGNKLRIVSYNILSDRYVDSDDKFPYCPLIAQGIHYRKQLIIKELEGYNADIICLQEVDDPHYKTYYKQELKSRGFRSFFNRKGNCIPEGLACAFRQDRFRLVDFKHIVLKMALHNKQFKEIVKILDLNEEVKNEFLKQHTSLQSVVLEEKSTKKIIVVGNTHLFYRPDANHIRLLQAFTATSHLDYIKRRMMREFQTSNVAVIFCGDFNSDVVKSLYGFMIRGTIDREHEDCLKISPSGEAILYHKLHLVSACDTPKYTNYTDVYKGCLDYIFIEKQKLSVIQIVPLPKEEELEQFDGLPNEFYPSDHLSLVVDVQFKSSR